MKDIPNKKKCTQNLYQHCSSVSVGGMRDLEEKFFFMYVVCVYKANLHCTVNQLEKKAVKSIFRSKVIL